MHASYPPPATITICLLQQKTLNRVGVMFTWLWLKISHWVLSFFSFKHRVGLGLWAHFSKEQHEPYAFNSRLSSHGWYFYLTMKVYSDNSFVYHLESRIDWRWLKKLVVKPLVFWMTSHPGTGAQCIRIFFSWVLSVWPSFLISW